MAIIKLANIAFRENEIREAIAGDKTILAKGRKLYAILETRHGIIARPIYQERGSLPLTQRGRYHILSPAAANKLVGFSLCI
jgi:hypothetical protein